MSRTLTFTAAIVFAALLSVQFARVAIQPTAGDSPSIAATVPAEPPLADTTTKAIEELAAWPMAAGR